ncbi:MAG: glycine--tRNA ligase subunit beta [Burkholderiales bacterium]|nr:glycine--tRNA ligase subunit beta [Burkholderiales bacterium]
MDNSTLLIEFLTEELPPNNLFDIGNSFTSSINNELKKFVTNLSKETAIASPRRFGCVITNVNFTEPDSGISRKGPTINSAYVDQEPSKALTGFMRSCGITDVSQLEQKDGYFYAKQKNLGKTLKDVLGTAINNSLKKLPIAKKMRWGNNDFSFIRPVHNLLVMFGNNKIELDNLILGLKTTNFTYGHRVLSNGKIIIDHADNYFTLLETQGMVIAEFIKRKKYIIRKLLEATLPKAKQQCTLTHAEVEQIKNYVDHQEIEDILILLEIVKKYAKQNIYDRVDPYGSNPLIDEVTSLVEYPVILQGQFNPDYLEIPQECLILSMKKNQKYFALVDNNGKSSGQFLFVANISSKNPQIVIKGNERVLDARLADAKFFYEVDLKHNLDFYVNKLQNVVYHNKIGTQGQRITRLENIAEQFAKLFNVDPNIAKYAAHIMKADLATEMVGEFPELQGIMGREYAKAQNEKPNIANAIEQHYYPRFSDDKLPHDDLSITLALSDKLETLVAIWGIGLIPTGDKDPFALRRMALGVVRILLKPTLNNINIYDLLEITFKSFDGIALNPNTIDEVYEFILQRLFNYFTTNTFDGSGYPNECVQSICSVKPKYFALIPALIREIDQYQVYNALFDDQDNATRLIISANKRIENILKKNVVFTDDLLVDEKLLVEPAEQELFAKLETTSSQIDQFANSGNWNGYFNELEQFSPLITNFFDNVMVIDENIAIRNNRLALISSLYKMMNKYCKLSVLSY